jgi:hypothetical protein
MNKIHIIGLVTGPSALLHPYDLALLHALKNAHVLIVFLWSLLITSFVWDTSRIQISCFFYTTG